MTETRWLDEYNGLLIQHDDIFRYKKIFCDILDELDKADAKYVDDPMTHMKVGLGTIKAELAELEREVDRVMFSHPRPEALRKEAVQVAAMAVKFLRDICDKEKAG